jgi:hypothetical protein
LRTAVGLLPASNCNAEIAKAYAPAGIGHEIQPQLIWKGFIMKRTLLSAMLCLGAVFTLPAFARGGWVQTTNVIMSYETLPSGDVTMKVSMPKAEWLGMGRDMRESNGVCRITSVTPGDTTTMILICSRQ